MNAIIMQRFGTSDRLKLSKHEWLSNSLHAKTVKFDIGRGGAAPEVNWEDRVASIALIKNRAEKSLASLLVWGSDDKWNWQESFDTVVAHLADAMLSQCKRDGRKEPRGYKGSLEELCRLVARMTLHFELYDLWELYTTKGRLMFSGIAMNDRTYSNHFLKYQQDMLDELQNMVASINQSIYGYVKELDY